MATLPDQLRSQLEKTVVDAREVAEDGGKLALESLAIHHYEFYEHMSEGQRELRNALRARARQLGDVQDSTGRIDLKHLVLESAYAHWHEMLFARFLAENGLLRDFEDGIPITLAEAEELGRAKGMDKWAYASNCATGMLPQIFRPDDPVLQFKLPKEKQVRLEQLLDDLPTEVFTATDSLGWVYQFWQARRKDEINKSEVKIGADELPAVTQLFTEPYMVDFLLHNTLGAWWAGKKLQEQPELAETAKSEDELRRAVSLPGLNWDYLRLVRGEDGESGPWRPAAGTFDGWPDNAAELKVLDPCCGSGHFLVTGMHILTAIRIAEEGLSQLEAVDAVLADNLHGLEIDQRCTQIAAFNLALEAWKLTGYHELSTLNVACSGIAVGASRESWMKLAGDNWRLQNGMERLWELFQQAPVLGSLIEPGTAVRATVLEEGADALLPLLIEAMRGAESDDTQLEAGVAALGMMKAFHLLMTKYHVIATNVPYLLRGKQEEELRNYCEEHYEIASQDLATVFLLRTARLCTPSGVVAAVTPQNWLFLKTYKKLRKQLLTHSRLVSASRIGSGDTAKDSWDVLRALVMLNPTSSSTDYPVCGIETKASYEAERAVDARTSEVLSAYRDELLALPDCRIILGPHRRGEYLTEYGSCVQGMIPQDRRRLVRAFHEFESKPQGWVYFQGSTDETAMYSGWHQVFDLSLFERICESIGGRLQGRRAWGRPGVSITIMRHVPVSLYSGHAFDANAHVFYCHNEEDLGPIWCYLSDAAFNSDLRRVDPKIGVTNASIEQVRTDLAVWRPAAQERYPTGLPSPHTDDPTQWIFHGHPANADDALQVAVARLLGYRWPAELDEEMELADFQRELVHKCDKLLPFADEDGIVCITSIRGEETAANRLRKLLQAAYGDEWKASTEAELIEATGSNAKSLEEWLQNDFFEQHCNLFHHRPFIWHIWDGIKRDGFSALVDYHKLAEGGGNGRRLLTKLTYSYLGDWISRQESAKQRGESGADDKLIAALELKKRLEAIIAGELPYDIFVRWKPLSQQPVGWEPDINDGVRLNIRPFMASDLPREVCKGARKGAGILRWKPNIKWRKDRGKEPHRDKADYPWFWSCEEGSEDFTGGAKFDGNRWNNLHYSSEVKRAAREKNQEVLREGARM